MLGTYTKIHQIKASNLPHFYATVRKSQLATATPSVCLLGAGRESKPSRELCLNFQVYVCNCESKSNVCTQHIYFLDVLGGGSRGSRGSRGSSIFHLFYFQSVCMFALGWWFPWFSWFFDFPMFFIFESNVHVSSGMVLLVVRLALGFLRCVG